MKLEVETILVIHKPQIFAKFDTFSFPTSSPPQKIIQIFWRRSFEAQIMTKYTI